MTRCKSCKAPVIYPFDAEPAGAAWVRFGPTGDRIKHSQTWVSHFATCRDADQHRKGKTDAG